LNMYREQLLSHFLDFLRHFKILSRATVTCPFFATATQSFFLQ
jgi:hypothetical protein